MTLLDPDLWKVAELCPNEQFSPATCAVIAMQSLDILERAGFLHRDVKPSYIAVGLNFKKHFIYFVHFGFARLYCTKEIVFYYHNEQGLLFEVLVHICRSTCMVVSITLRGTTFGLYSLMNLRRGTLPWLNYSSYKIVQKIKKRIIVDRRLEDVEKEYFTFHQYLRHLEYNWKPDYQLIQEMFASILTPLQIRIAVRLEKRWTELLKTK